MEEGSHVHTTKRPTTEKGLTGVGVPTTVDRTRQRPLGKVYRLILSYEPKQNAAIQDEIDEAILQTDNVQSVIG
jgi:hypothetical protein